MLGNHLSITQEEKPRFKEQSRADAVGKWRPVGAALFFFFVINKGDVDAGKDRPWASA